jgi:mercuric ion transport protein
VSVDRGRVAGWLGGAAGAGGAGIAMLVCCTTTAAAAGGGLAAAGGVLRSPWLIAAGLVVVALALAAFIVQRVGRPNAGGDPCCPPSVANSRPAPPKETSQR